MPLPAGVTGVSVSSGQPLCLPDGTPYQGKLTVVGPDLVTITGQDVVLGGAVEVDLVDGQCSVTLAPNDLPGMSPSGWTYTVIGHFSNAPGWVRYISLSKDNPEVSLADVLVPDPAVGEFSVLADVATLLAKAANLSDLASASTARANLGLRGAAVLDVGTVAGTVADGSTLPDQPGDQGFLAWTYDPIQAGHVTAQTVSGVAGRITLSRILVRKQITASNLWLGLSGVDTGAVLSNCYLGIYDVSGTLRAVTADISSQLVIATNAKPISFPLVVPAALPPGGYYVAMLLNGTWATNGLTFKCTGGGSTTNAKLTAPNLRMANILSGQTSLPASLSMASQATNTITTGWGSQWYGID